MKTFMIFLALVLVFTGFLAYSSDMDRYVKLQGHLKALAEECAAGSSLFTDEEEYADGRLVIDERSASEYIAFLISETQKSMPPLADGIIEADYIFFDDAKGYSRACDYRLALGRPGAAVTLTYKGPDLFRLPFISVCTVTRTATYQWVY